MNRGLYTFVVLLATIRLSRSQSPSFNLDKFRTAVDKNVDGNITRMELQDLFISNIGRNTSGRCSFLDWLVDGYGGSSLRLSVLFDLMQPTAGMVSDEDFSENFLGGPTVSVVSVSGLSTNVKTTDALIDQVLNNPAGYTSGPTFWSYTQFDVQKWADNSDKDNNSYISQQEMSAAMRALDQNGDWKIMRCEFVNSMTLYKQNTVTSSKVYDVIFSHLDLTWADVDSDLLLSAMSKEGGDATKKQFVDWFRKQNQAAASVQLSDSDQLDDGSSTPYTASMFCCLTSSVLVFLSKLIVL